MSGPIEETFWPRVDRSGDCWLWTGARQPTGYGYVYAWGRPRYAHRVAWELVNGTIPAGLSLLHQCDNPPCVRPTHLSLGTGRDNSQDALAKGRLHPVPGSQAGHARLAADPRLRARGERFRSAKLTEIAVRLIREASEVGTTRAELARRFGVSESLILAVVQRRAWRHVP